MGIDNLNIQRINEVFVQSKYTKTEVAKSCGLTRPTLDGLLRGADVKISTLAAWAKFFNKPIAYFLNDSALGNEITTSGDFSPASDSGDITMNVGDPILAERLKAMEAIIKEKDDRIGDLQDRISDLRDMLNMKKPET